MGYLDSLLGGFHEAHHAHVQQQHDDQIRASDRESKIFDALLKSPDPEIQATALSGMLQASQPGKKKPGLAGWMGEMQAHPAFGQLQALLKSTVPQTTETAPGLVSHPSVGVGPALTTPPAAEGSAGMADTSPVAPEGSAEAPTTPPPTLSTMSRQPTQISAPQTVTKQVPRQIFPDAAKEAGDKQAAVLKAERESDQARLAAGGTPQFGRTSAATRPPAQTAAQQKFQSTISAIMATTPGISRADATLQAYKEDRAKVTQGTDLHDLRLQKMAADLTASLGGRPPSMAELLNHATQALPDATEEDKLQLVSSLWDATRPTPATTPPPGPTATTAGTTTPPPAPTSGGSTPAAAPAPAGATTPPPAASPDLFKKLQAAVPPSLMGSRRTEGKPLPAQATETLAKARSTLDLTDRALAALSAHKSDNTLEGMVNLSKNYRAGYDDVNTAATALTDLAGLQNANSPFLQGGSRSQHWMLRKEQHVPRIPSYRQSATAGVPGIGAKTVNAVSGFLPGGDANMFDTPATAYTKLELTRTNLANFIKEEEAAQKTRGGGGSSSVSPAAAGAGPQLKQVNGQWVFSTP